jgi:hypothetical protein
MPSSGLALLTKTKVTYDMSVKETKASWWSRMTQAVVKSGESEQLIRT